MKNERLRTVKRTLNTNPAEVNTVNETNVIPELKYIPLILVKHYAITSMWVCDNFYVKKNS